MHTLEPFACLVFLIIAFLFSGLAQVAWLKSDRSRVFARPLDGGRTFRGRRLFGDNKTVRGFVVMVPATALAFAIFGGGRSLFGPAYADGIWDVSLPAYFLTGALVGFAFMLAELPNSFFKRQSGIGSGQAPKRAWSKTLCFVVDQLDSVIGGLLALSLVVPVPLTVWASVLIGGLVMHWLFNVLLKQLGMKTRAA